MRFSRRSVLSHGLAVLLICVASVGQQKSATNENTPKYRNPKLAIEDRVADLLSRMTLEEKVGQIVPSREPHVIDSTGTFTDETARATLASWDKPDLDFPPKRAAILRNGL
ncbi:MAG: glycoside hydrolase family 3 protein [Acidobacteriaceae bacterium]|nr:glycoside hydrolase family 3 protein [Acidobacteriaceae bacterium]